MVCPRIRAGRPKGDYVRIKGAVGAATTVILGLSAGIAAAEGLRGAGVVTAVSGPVAVTREESPAQPLKFRDPLYWRDVVEARKDGIARVLLGGKTTVTVRELSRLELREERQADGMRYTVELVAGKVRASVARALMRPGEAVEVRTRNTVASVRGTDFVVETVDRPSPAGAFGLLGVRDVAEGIPEGAGQTGETVVVTLSGVVEVTNRLAGTGRVERLGAYEAARISGRHDPVRFQVTPHMFRPALQGLTVPRPREVTSGDAAASVGEKVARDAQAAVTGPPVSAGAPAKASSEPSGLRTGKGDGGSSPASREAVRPPDRGHRPIRGHRR